MTWGTIKLVFAHLNETMKEVFADLNVGSELLNIVTFAGVNNLMTSSGGARQN